MVPNNNIQISMYTSSIVLAAAWTTHYNSSCQTASNRACHAMPARALMLPVLDNHELGRHKHHGGRHSRWQQGESMYVSSCRQSRSHGTHHHAPHGIIIRSHPRSPTSVYNAHQSVKKSNILASALVPGQQVPSSAEAPSSSPDTPDSLHHSALPSPHVLSTLTCYQARMLRVTRTATAPVIIDY